LHIQSPENMHVSHHLQGAGHIVSAPGQLVTYFSLMALARLVRLSGQPDAALYYHDKLTCA